MSQEWRELTRITQGKPIAIERIRMTGQDIAIEGSFDLPPLARLSAEDQVFVIAFIHCHGSIKEMERIFGISYPTVKNRLQRLAGQLEMVENFTSSGNDEVLSQLERGEISADEAIARLSQ